GGKVELGLLPIGALGMIGATVVAALSLQFTPGLVAGIILIGFFTGFYIVPLFTLLQHRAPRTSKGDFIATSNFINVTGAILASLLFFMLVKTAKVVGVARSVPQEDIARGRLISLTQHWGPVYLEVEDPVFGRKAQAAGLTAASSGGPMQALLALSLPPEDLARFRVRRFIKHGDSTLAARSPYKHLRG